MGRVKDVLNDKVRTSTIKKLGKQKIQPTEGEIHKAFMEDYAREFEAFKEAVITSWEAHHNS